MQFVVKEITDQQVSLLDNGLRMVSQLLAAWRNAADKVPGQIGAAAAGGAGSAMKRQKSSLSATSARDDSASRPDLATTLHMAEGFALVMLCHCRIATRRICHMILKEASAEIGC